ncbi:MAG: hypothetical protein U0T75_03715 [Chitinophagales bacterium]
MQKGALLLLQLLLPNLLPSVPGSYNYQCKLQRRNQWCNDITVGGGAGTITYAWSNGATTEDLTGLGAGSYSVTVTVATVVQQVLRSP